MKILKKVTLNQSKGRNGKKPVMIVCHRTCGNFDGAVSWLCNPESQASAHFVVAKDGRVVQLVDIQDTAWCNGTSQDSKSSKYYKQSTLEYVKNNSSNANSYTISIEFEGLSNELGNLSTRQFNAATELICFIVEEVKRIYDYNLKVDLETLVGHCHITPNWKPNCPGSAFPYSKLINKVKENVELLEKRKYVINGKAQVLECSILNGVTRAPIREIAEQLDFNVRYDEKTKVTTISK